MGKSIFPSDFGTGESHSSLSYGPKMSQTVSRGCQIVGACGLKSISKIKMQRATLGGDEQMPRGGQKSKNEL